MLSLKKTTKKNEHAKAVNDGLFSFLGSSLTGKRHIMLLENTGKVSFPSNGTFNNKNVRCLEWMECQRGKLGEAKYFTCVTFMAS